MKLYINDANDFLNKLRSLPKLPGNINLGTVHVVALYPNITLMEGLFALRKRLENQMENYISSDMLCDLAGIVLRNLVKKNWFGKKTLKQKRETEL